MWHISGCDDRIAIWRDWRTRLGSMDLCAALSEIATAWSKIPLASHYLSPDETHRWPSPWELINDNFYCDLAVCLGMHYSISLSAHGSHVSEIIIYKDHLAHSWYHLCQIDGGKYVLNWDKGRIVNTLTLPISARLVHRYKDVDLAAWLG